MHPGAVELREQDSTVETGAADDSTGLVATFRQPDAREQVERANYF